MKILKKKVYQYNKRTFVSIKYEVPPDPSGYYRRGIKELQARLDVSLPWMAEHLIGWADFDQHFTIALFCDSLQKLGEGLIRWDNALHALRNGRRAIYAAHLLRTAYDYTMYNDKAIKNHRSRCLITFKKVRLGMQMSSAPIFDNAMGMSREEYEDKMYKIALKRCEAVDKAKIDYAWAYIKKWTPFLWD